MTLGENIRTHRKQAGLSQEALAEQLGVSRQAISKWENDNGMPETENLIKMATLFDTSLDALLGTEASSDTDTTTTDVLPQPEETTAAPPPEKGLSLDTAQSYLAYETRKYQRIALAGLLFIGSLGLTYFFNSLIMIIWMLIDILAITLLIMVCVADDPYKSLRRTPVTLGESNYNTLNDNYNNEKKNLDRERFCGIIAIGVDLLLPPLITPATIGLENLCLAGGMILCGFGAALCIFATGRIHAYRHLLSIGSTLKE